MKSDDVIKIGASKHVSIEYLEGRWLPGVSEWGSGTLIRGTAPRALDHDI